MPAEAVAARFRVSGRVQGVGFRAATRREAVRLGLVGHAVNCADGSVEVIAQGAPTALEALADWLKAGPPQALVVGIEREALAATDRFGFSTA